MRPEPRPELAALAAAIHGGSDDARLLDFSTGVSPFPPPQEIVAAARNADLSRYPHPTALPVREEIARQHDVHPDHVVVGAGSVELIWALARAFAGPDRRAVVVRPAFGEYEQALKASGATVATVDMNEPLFAFPTQALDAALVEARTAAVFICRPSNPCLTVAPALEIAALARRWPQTLFVVDEAYLPMFEDVVGIAPAPNVAALRSLTKIFALPGLRIGYLLAASQVAAVVQASLPPWNVSSPAQAAAIVATRLLPVHAPSIRTRITALRVALTERLSKVAGPPQQARGPFLLYRTPSAAALSSYFRQQGILIRSGASFGLPHHVRLGVRSEAGQEVLVRRWLEAP